MKLIITCLVMTVGALGSYASDIPDCKPSCPSPEAIFHHPRDCTKFFHCAFNVAYEKICPSDLQFDQKTLRCDYPKISQCSPDPQASCSDDEYQDTSSVPDHTVSAPPPPADHSSIEDIDEEEDTIEDTTDSVDNCIPSCPKHGVQLPNKRDCSKFYQCAHGAAFEMICPSDLQFSADNGRCEYADIANCVADSTASCDSTESEKVVSVPEKDVSVPENCLPTCTSGIMAHPRDCGKFFLCSGKGRVPQEMSCPAGLHYSERLHLCDYTYSAECTAKADNPCE